MTSFRQLAVRACQPRRALTPCHGSRKYTAYMCMVASARVQRLATAQTSTTTHNTHGHADCHRHRRPSYSPYHLNMCTLSPCTS